MFSLLILVEILLKLSVWVNCLMSYCFLLSFYASPTTLILKPANAALIRSTFSFSSKSESDYSELIRTAAAETGFELLTSQSQGKIATTTIENRLTRMRAHKVKCPRVKLILVNSPKIFSSRTERRFRNRRSGNNLRGRVWDRKWVRSMFHRWWGSRRISRQRDHAQYGRPPVYLPAKLPDTVDIYTEGSQP